MVVGAVVKFARLGFASPDPGWDMAPLGKSHAVYKVEEDGHEC